MRLLLLTDRVIFLFLSFFSSFKMPNYIKIDPKKCFMSNSNICRKRILSKDWKEKTFMTETVYIGGYSIPQ